MTFPTDPSLYMTGSLLLEVVRCNPNGDPDLGGAPRITPDGRVMMTNGAIKRVVRDQLHRMGHPLYVARGADLGERQEEAASLRKADKSTDAQRAAGTRRIGEAFIDVRLFGGAITRMGTRPRGPIQFAEAVSLDEVVVSRVGITRVAGSKDEDQDGLRGNMGDYSIVDYAVIRADFTFNPFDAVSTSETPGLSPDDLTAFWTALLDGWEYSRSARRAGLNPIRLVVFSAKTEALRGGREPSHRTRARLVVERCFGEALPSGEGAYKFYIDRENLPEGMVISEWCP